MSDHDHREHVEGCFRCDLSRVEAITERDVEALGKLIRPFVPDANWQRDAASMVAARAILTSDWFAQRIAQARREVVEAVEEELDDADQIIDTLKRPNYITVWGVRRALYPFGGREHRWQVPAERCAECGHLAWNHNNNCAECECLLSRREAEWGRDEAMDDSITQAVWEDAVTNGDLWTRGETGGE